MKTQSLYLWVLLAGALALGLGQGCAQTEALVEPTGSEALPSAQAEAPPAERTVNASAIQAEAPKPVIEPAPEVKAAEIAPPASPPVEVMPAQPLSPAKIVTAIDVQRQDDGLMVVITGDGELSYQVVRLDGNRLILDLPGVVNATKRHAIPVGHPMVRQIRIGMHQLPLPKLRVVLDLERAVPYAIVKSGSQLKVTLSDQVSMPNIQEATAPARIAPAMAEKPVVENSRRSAPVPAPERLKLLDTLPSLAQPKTGDSGDPGTAGGADRYPGKRISLDFQDAEISSVLRLIADVSGLNMVVGESVKAKVTLKLLNVPWDQALDLILKLNNLGQIREGNILWIDTLANITKLRDDASKAKDATLKAEELVTRILYLNYADATKSVDVAKSNLSPRGEIKVDSRTNSLVVRDIPDNLVKVEKIVRDLDQRTPQVQIEARIVQAGKTFARGLGIQWGVSGISGSPQQTGIHTQGPVTLNLGATGAAFSQASDFLVNLPAAGAGTSTFGFLIGKFLGTSGTLDMRLSAGESLGLSKVVSSPKIITLDNKAAKIEQGSQIPYQTTSLQGTQTTFVDATLTLNVTPHVILHANTVRLEIKATKNSLGSGSTQAGPTIDKKEATTEVLLRDGETTVLGGIFEETRNDNTSGVPWFNRIPFLGWLFKTEAITVLQTELLVFVTPTILKD
ncbi:MAG: type IV pilus secretin PilQ [Nitrospirae bacterium]|nr:MAG: type IV pilus secretin PilQ [Nitrospirota bacterium]